MTYTNVLRAALCIVIAVAILVSIAVTVQNISLSLTASIFDARQVLLGNSAVPTIQPKYTEKQFNSIYSFLTTVHTTGDSCYIRAQQDITTCVNNLNAIHGPGGGGGVDSTQITRIGWCIELITPMYDRCIEENSAN